MGEYMRQKGYRLATGKELLPSIDCEDSDEVQRKANIMKDVRTLLSALLVCAWSWPQSVPAQDLSSLFEQVKPSVVVVETEGMPLALDGLGLSAKTQGLGSGVLIGDRRVLTAAHVVQAEDLITVRFHDGQTIGAKVVSSSQQADVALLELKKKPKGITPAQIANSDNAKVGEPIFIVGAPYGLSYTLTAGHISNRITAGEASSGFYAMEFFQTDAAINEGNSGGPMFNGKGQVIGVVSHILSKSGGFEGLGFAATSSATSRILLEGEHVWTGVEAQFIGEPITALLNVPQPVALLVQRVASDSLGSKLRLQGGYLPVPLGNTTIMLGGDIVLEVVGVPIEGPHSSMQIREKLASLKKRDTVSVVVLRKGRRVQLKCKL